MNKLQEVIAEMREKGLEVEASKIEEVVSSQEDESTGATSIELTPEQKKLAGKIRYIRNIVVPYGSWKGSGLPLCIEWWDMLTKGGKRNYDRNYKLLVTEDPKLAKKLLDFADKHDLKHPI